MPSDLHCPDCGAEYTAGPEEPWRCACGHALEFVDSPRPEGTPLPLSKLDTSDGLWTFFEFLPIEKHVTLGEGFTPLVEAPAWNARFKLEYVFPTGSFKDRGATTTLSRAVELGVEKVIEDSSGNAGAAIATYAARAGLEADVYVPADVKQSKLMAIQRAGARPVRVEGTREDVTTACVEAVEGTSGRAVEPSGVESDDGSAVPSGDGSPVPNNDDSPVPNSDDSAVGSGADPTVSNGADPTTATEGDPTVRIGTAPRQGGEGWYASHAWNPAFYAGTMTFAFEVAAQRGWTVPDAVVLPIGHGTLFLGAYRGFSLLNEAGIVDGIPRLLGAQAAGYAPIVTALGGDARGEDGERNDIADGIRVTEPARGTQIVAAVEATDGDVVALGADPVETALDRLHRDGFYVEPTCAVAPAALRHYRETGVLSGREDVVVPLTGSGLKTL